MLVVQAPAKINLFLAIKGKRADGYHELASLFQTLELSDTLKMELSDHDRFTCSDPSLETKDNLCLKALSLFRERCDTPFFLHLHLSKKIPVQAGLGGGSSDAAATLKGINELLNYPLSKEDLASLASELGSDVPFFLNGGTAFCTGRGEKVKTLKPLEAQQVVIVKPPYGLSTAEVYRQVDPLKLSDRDPLLALQDHLFGKGEYFNDLEEAAFSLEPRLKELKKTLLAGGFSRVILCGSGSALFCLGRGEVSLPSDYQVFRTRFSSFIS